MAEIVDMQKFVNQRLMASGAYQDVSSIPSTKGISEHIILSKDRVFARRFLASTNPYEAIELLRAGVCPLFSIKLKSADVQTCLGYHSSVMSHSAWFGIDSKIDLSGGLDDILLNIPFEMAISGFVFGVMSGSTNMALIYRDDGLCQYRWLKQLFSSVSQDALQRSLINALSDIGTDSSATYYSAVLQISAILHRAGHVSTSAKFNDFIFGSPIDLDKTIAGIDLMVSCVAVSSREGLDHFIDQFISQDIFEFYTKSDLQNSIRSALSKAGKSSPQYADFVEKVVVEFASPELTVDIFKSISTLSDEAFQRISDKIHSIDFSGLGFREAESILLSVKSKNSLSCLVSMNEFAISDLIYKSCLSNNIYSSDLYDIQVLLSTLPLSGGLLTVRAVDRLVESVARGIFVHHKDNLSKEGYFHGENSLKNIAVKLATLITSENDINAIEELLGSMMRDDLVRLFISDCQVSNILLGSKNTNLKKLVISSELNI